MVGVKEFADTDAGGASDLVGVAGADAPAGGADGRAGAEDFFLDVVREDEVGMIADGEVMVADPDTGRAQRVDLFEKPHRVYDDAVANDGTHVRRQDARREKRQLVGLAIANNGVPRVGATVVADDDMMVGGEQVYDLAFGLVTPLQTDNTGAGHSTPR